MSKNEGSGIRLLNAKELEEKISISRTTVWAWERDGKFPKRLKLGQQKAVWVESEVDDWILSRPRGAGA